MGANKKKGKLTRKNRSLAKESFREAGVPKSFVIHQGIVSANVKSLISDFKRVMEPNTAWKLKAKKQNRLMDFVKMAGPLKVTHIIVFSQTDTGLYLKIGRMPQGPTFTFRIENFCLLKDVISSQKRHLLHNKHALYAPCFITNLQPAEGDQHLQLCSQMFLDMFPTISPSNVKPSEIKRCCLVHYDEENSLLDFRHYAISVRPVGLSKATRKIMGRRVPNLGSFQDISDFIGKSEVLSESEAEDIPSSQINLGEAKQGNLAKKKSTVKLSEIGPRLTLKLMKIEGGYFGGTVLYHNYIEKTAKELLDTQKRAEKRRLLLQMRQKEQQKNIKLKKQKKEEHRQKCLKGMGIVASTKRKTPDDEDDDAKYYEQEVGEKPDADLFKKSGQKKLTKKHKKHTGVVKNK